MRLSPGTALTPRRRGHRRPLPVERQDGGDGGQRDNVAHEPITAVVVATAHRIDTRCSIMPTSFDCEWRRSTRPRRDGACRQRLTSAAEAIAPAPNSSAQSPAQGEANANAATGRARMSAIGWHIAAILARSMTARGRGAVVRKSGASSAESAIQDESAGELRGDHHQRGREGDPDRAGRTAAAP